MWARTHSRNGSISRDAREHEGGAAAELLLEMHGPAAAGHRHGQQPSVHRQGQRPLERAEGDDELAAGMIALDDQRGGDGHRHGDVADVVLDDPPEAIRLRQRGPFERIPGHSLDPAQSSLGVEGSIAAGRLAGNPCAPSGSPFRLR